MKLKGWKTLRGKGLMRNHLNICLSLLSRKTLLAMRIDILKIKRDPKSIEHVNTIVELIEVYLEKDE